MVYKGNERIYVNSVMWRKAAFTSTSVFQWEKLYVSKFFIKRKMEYTTFGTIWIFYKKKKSN